MFGGSLLCLFSNGPFLLIHIRLEALKILAQHKDKTIKKYPYEYRLKYYSQRTMARKRDIPWHFDMHSWIAWWGSDIERIGRRKGCLCMARKGDEGPYHPDNVFKCDVGKNHKDWWDKYRTEDVPRIKHRW